MHDALGAGVGAARGEVDRRADVAGRGAEAVGPPAGAGVEDEIVFRPRIDRGGESATVRFSG